MKSSLFHRRARSQASERGYILLTLILVVSLMIIAAAIAIPAITFEIKRDKEEEMIHRGVQYSRAIRAYYKKLGRYPAKIEDLENTNNIRFLRRRYKDPLTGKDFKLLHFGEAQMALGGGLGGGAIPGATPAGALNGQTGGAFGQSSFGQSSFGQSGTGNGGLQGNSSTGDATNANGQATGDQSQTGDQSGDSKQSGSSTQSGINSGNLTAQTFGGAPIVGVASLSKEKTIREYNHKKKYNEWQFIYDPSMDRGGIINAPYQPALMTFSNQNLNGTQGNGNQPGQSPFGQSPLGQSPGIGSGPGFGNQGGFGNQNPQQNQQPQQPQQNDSPNQQ